MYRCPQVPRLASATLLATTLVLAGSCSHVAGPILRPDGPGPEWPKPPDEPRIRYIGELTGAAEMNGNESGWDRFFASVFGSDDPVRLVAPRSVVRSRGTSVIWVGDPGSGALHRFDLAQRDYLQISRIRDRAIRSPVSLADGPGGTILVCDSVAESITMIDRDSGEFVREIPLPSSILRPVGVAIVPEREWILVVDAVAHDIKILNLDGRLVKTVGRRGTSPGEFNFPCAVAFSHGHVWVADSGNHRIQKLNLDGESVMVIGQAGDAPGDMALPKSVALDSEGHIYVVDGRFENIQVFDSEGALLMSFGGEGHGPGQFWLPGALFIDERDWLWVCDPYNKRVQVFRYLGASPPEASGGRPSGENP